MQRRASAWGGGASRMTREAIWRESVRRSVELERLEKPRVTNRADTLLRSARNLELAGKNQGALDFSRQVVRDDPNTSQATVAAARVAALETLPLVK